MSFRSSQAFSSSTTSPYPVSKTDVAVGDTTYADVTPEFGLSAGHKSVLVEIYLSAKSSSGTVTFRLDTGSIRKADGTRLYQAGKEVAFDTSTGSISEPIRLSLLPQVAGDQTYLPTGSHGVLKVKSDGTGTCTIVAVNVLTEAP